MTTQTTSKGKLWTGRVLSILTILFMIMDGGMKAVKATPSMEGSAQLGWPAEHVQIIGIVLLICTVLYAIPRTAFIGAILLTGYLGGAVSIMVRADAPFWFPIMMAVFAWVGLGFRDERVRGLIR